MKTTIHNLKSLKIERLSYKLLLIPVCTNKLPKDLRTILARKFSAKIWELNHF